MTFKNDLEISGGNGTKDNPYVINQGDKTNYVDSYVRVGHDTWKVFYQKDGFVKLAYPDYVAEGENIYYSNTTSEFNPNKRYNIGYFLNNTLYNRLNYNSHFLDLTTYTGEISSDTSLYYGSIYNYSDYHNLGLDDYYLVNTTSTVGSMVYIYHNYGLLEEANVTDYKNIIPVICINEASINRGNGDGTLENPYIVE